MMLDKLKVVAHCAWHALDDSEDQGGDRILISRSAFDALSEALEAVADGDDIHYVLFPDGAPE